MAGVIETRVCVHALSVDVARRWFVRRGAAEEAGAEPRARLDALVRLHFDFVWRSLRRLGLPSATAEDAAQQVFLVVSRKLDAIAAGRERAFLFGVAVRVAADERKRAVHRREQPNDDISVHASNAPAPDELLAERRARDALDRILEEMPLDVRAVFILYELEELTVPMIASALAIPPGTAASRLRRGREIFQTEVAKLERRSMRDGGGDGALRLAPAGADGSRQAAPASAAATTRDRRGR